MTTVDPPTPAQLHDDLVELDVGAVLVDDYSRALYSTDASILQVLPIAIALPRSTEDLIKLVKYAHDHDLPISLRGAGTGLAGESLGSGLVIDVRRHLRQIIEIKDASVRVQPGVVWAELDQQLAAQGRMFAPDPVSGDRCTIGGMIATDAAGPHSLRYGATRDHLNRLTLILADGQVVNVGHEPVPSARPESDPLVTMLDPLAELLGRHAGAIEEEQPARFTKPGGYCLRGVWRDGILDLPRLIAGSEGTLAVVAEAELATVPRPAHRGLAIACFSRLEAAADAVLDSLEYQPTACDMLDRRLLTLARESNPVYERWIPPDTETLLLIEQEGSDPTNVRDRLERLHRRLTAGPTPPTVVLIDAEPELSLCWRLRQQVGSKLTQPKDAVQPIAFVENTAVPPKHLPRLLKLVQNIMKRHGVSATYLAHAGVGVLHTRPMLDVHRPDHCSKLEAIAQEVLEAVLECEGTFNAEHGVGWLRTGYLRRQYPKLSPVFARVKAIFDPQHRLNPGKIVGGDPGFPILKLRTPPRSAPLPPIEPQLRWNDLTLLDAAQRCNGCGSCRSVQPTMRMCPSFKVDQTEHATPRAKANLLRQMLLGNLDPKQIASDEFRELADTCVNCKMCRVECPSSVDIAKLMLETKAANVVEHGLSWSDWFFARSDRWARFAGANARVVNPLLGNRPLRWLMEKAVGLSATRRLPRLAPTTFLQLARRRGWSRPPISVAGRPRVAFLADTWVNHFEPELGESALQVLDHLGCQFYVPQRQGPSGMLPLRYGDLESARAMLQINLETFAELARNGFDIVSTEPSAILMFREDAAHLLQDPDLDLIAERSFEFTEYLHRWQQQQPLPTVLQSIPLTLGYHEPCHQRALGRHRSTLELLTHLPDLRMVPIDLGCSGMGGTVGMSRHGHEQANQAGRPLIERLRRDDIHYPVSQCSACRLHLEQATGKRALHPAHWLAIAYDLMQNPQQVFHAR